MPNKKTASNTFYEKPGRFDKLTKSQHQDLAFDLINAFALVKNPTDSALLLHDLLTRTEIRNLAKRLRIAKLILSGNKQEEIITKIHCSFGTIARVKTWLIEGGKGLQKVIRKLPKRKSEVKIKQSYPNPNLPSILVKSFQELGHKHKIKTIDNFLDSLEKKHLIDKQITEMVKEEYKRLAGKRKRKRFRKNITKP